MIAAFRLYKGRSIRRLEARIGLAIILAVSAVVLFTLAALLFIPHGNFTLFQRQWLITTVQSVVNAVNAAAPSERVALVHALPEREWFFIQWSQSEPVAQRRVAPPPPPHLDHRFEADLNQGLENVRKLNVSFMRRRPPRPRPPDGPPGPAPEASDASRPAAPSRAGRERPMPPPLGWMTRGESVVSIIPASGSSAQRESRDDLVPAVFDLEIQIGDGSWLHITPKQPLDHRWVLDILLPLIGSAIVIVVLSILTARRILAPLNALTSAAQKLGIGREATPIPADGLEEFASVAHALNDMHKRLSGLVEERTQMLAAISHDIRTALTRLRLNVEDVNDPGLKHTLGEEIAEMEKMISATLVFAHNDAQREASADVDLAALLISLIDDEKDKGNDADYLGPDHLVVRCQRLAIKRALVNLIDNAIKYGGKVRVELSDVGEQAEITICDDGPGIAEALHEAAFAPFHRLESSRSRDTGGVGLGLSIARDAIRAHMGRISLESPARGGLCARITLPC